MHGKQAADGSPSDIDVAFMSDARRTDGTRWLGVGRETKTQAASGFSAGRREPVRAIFGHIGMVFEANAGCAGEDDHRLVEKHMPGASGVLLPRTI